jgi:hypothetical protein
MSSAFTPSVGISNATTTVAGAVKLPNGQVSANTTNGYGSSSTKIVRFTNFTTIGTAITGADSASLGTVFTINEGGVYSIMASVGYLTVGFTSITLNDTLLSTTITGNLGNAIFVAPSGAPVASGYPVINNVTLRLAVGDTIRLHTDGVSAGMSMVNDTLSRFVITQVSVS